MSGGGQVAADAVRDMLVGLADALRMAQDTLSEAGRVSDARLGYEIPYLDFTFEVEFSEQTARETSAGHLPLLKLAPRAGSSLVARQATEVTSRISGRLVATPSHGGRPAALLELSLVAAEQGPAIEIQLGNTAGELLGDALVELQVDVEMTERLTGSRPEAGLRLEVLATQIALTNDRGVARVPVEMARLQGQRLVVKAESQGAMARMILGGDA